eukprot:1159641-Pelagomonas_calceolata.AAC.2
MQAFTPTSYVGAPPVFTLDQLPPNEPVVALTPVQANDVLQALATQVRVLRHGKGAMWRLNGFACCRLLQVCHCLLLCAHSKRCIDESLSYTHLWGVLPVTRKYWA